METFSRFFRLAAFSFCFAACVSTTSAQVSSAAFGEYLGGVRMINSYLSLNDTVPGITLKLTDTNSNYVLRIDSMSLVGGTVPRANMNNVSVTPDTIGGYILSRSGSVNVVVDSVDLSPAGIPGLGMQRNLPVSIALVNGRISGDTLDANFTVAATVTVIIFPITITIDVHFNGLISFDPLAITRVNNMIDFNGLSYPKPNRLAWDFATWNDATPKQLIKLDVSNKSLSGSASFANLTTLKWLNCGNNSLSTIDVSGCTNLDTLICNNLPISSLNLASQSNLKLLDCSNDQFATLNVGSCTNLQTLNCQGNNLTALDLSALNALTTFNGSNQSANFVLFRNGPSSWVFPFSLNSPSFDNAALSYSSGNIVSTSDTALSTDFTVQTNKVGMPLSGTMTFSYQEPPYDPLAISRINTLIDNNVLVKTKNDPASWEGDFTQWDYSNPRQLTHLYLNNKGLTGTANLSGLTGLIYVEIEHNGLTALNTSGCTSLQTLLCDNNNLTQLTLSGCTGLTTLDCGTNSLSALDLTGLTLLTTLDCSNNAISTLNVASSTLLTTLDCSNNAIAVLNLTGLNALTTFDGSNQSVNLTLDKITSGVYALLIPLNSPVFDTTVISHADGVLISIDSTITSADFVAETGKVGEQLSGTIYFTYSSLAPLYDSLAVARINNLIDSNGLSAAKNYPVSWDGSFTVWDNANPKQLREINLSFRSLSGDASFEGLTSLQRLNCSRNNLTTIDLTGLTALEYLDCSYNVLTSLDMTDLTSIESLNCSGNTLTALDATALTTLQSLNCGGNDFTSLSVSGMTSLQSLTCSYGNLVQIDASGADNLKEINCQNNTLTDLDVSGCDSLNILYCQNNSLTELDLSTAKALRQLYCQYNSLSVLNLSGLTALQQLYCQYNSLCYLDLGGLNALSSYNGSNQTAYLTLYNDGAGSYRRDMLLLSPSNFTSGITYSLLGGGCLVSDDTNIVSTPFITQTNRMGMALSGTMHLAYEDPIYDPVAIARINGMIDNNGLTETKDSPLSWNFTTWSNTSPKQLLSLYLDDKGLTGTVSLAGLIFIKEIELQNNELDGLDIGGCTSLHTLRCENNRLTALDLTTLTDLDYNACHLFGQSPQLVLTNTNIGEYTLVVALNAPTFDQSAITYSGGVLKSTDNTVAATNFTAETGVNGLQVSGIISFSYTGQIIPPTITSTNDDLPDGTVGQTYTATLAADGDQPLTWSIIDGSLPTDLSLDGATGEIYGTPSTDGVFTFTVEARNNWAADTQQLTILINSVGIGDYELPVVNYVIYPNPTTGLLYVSTAGRTSGRMQYAPTTTTIELFDVVGATVGAYRIHPEEDRVEIDISHLSAGLYFLKIDGKVAKVVKE